MCLMVAAIALSMLAVGCASARHPFGEPSPGPVVHVALTQSGQYFTLPERRRLAVHLPEREGHKWGLSELPDKEVLAPGEAVSETVVLDHFTVFWFTAASPGITRFRIEERSQDPDAPPTREFTLTVRVVY